MKLVLSHYNGEVAKWTLLMDQSCLECLVLESEEGPDLTSPFTSCESLCL